MAGRLKVVLTGFGSVGRSLVKVIVSKRDLLAMKHRLSVDVVAVVDSKGMALKAGGFSDYELMKLCELPRSGVRMFEPYAFDYVDINHVYDETQPDVHVELTPSNYVSGEPGLSNVLNAVKRGIHVVLANKAPLALRFSDVISLALVKGVTVKFRATVMGGTPLIDTLTSMRSYEIMKVEGILNATTNFVLTKMHEELIDFREALGRAQALGVAEVDPTLDVEGVDAAAKLVILSNIAGRPVTLDKVYRESILDIPISEVVKAVNHGNVIKHIARLDLRDGQASVRVVTLPKVDPLARVEGILNGVRVRTDVGELMLIGKGGGGVETAHSVLDDLLSIALRGGVSAR
ncbi:MAG: homoserine dehydrogenase [Zestosphaera sp.]